jgi:hypothetical protein
MPVDLDAVRKRHERYRHVDIRRDCKHCDEPYPCDVIQLADEVERQLSRISDYQDACSQKQEIINGQGEEIERLRAQMSQPRALLVESFQAACSENVTLREALEWYEIPAVWEPNDSGIYPILLDEGDRAREALKDESWRTDNQDTARKQRAIEVIKTKGTIL